MTCSNQHCRFMSLTWCYNCSLSAAGVLWRHWGAGPAFHSFKMRRVLFFTLGFPAFMQPYPLHLTLLSGTILLHLFAPFPTTWDRGTFRWWGITNDKNTEETNGLIHGVLLQGPVLYLLRVPGRVTLRLQYGWFRLFSNRVDRQPVSWNLWSDERLGESWSIQILAVKKINI